MYTLLVPTGEDLTTTVEKGMYVKLCFTEKKEMEAMWVKVKKIDGDNFVGTLRNDPVAISSIQFGHPVRFRYEHIREFFKGFE